MSSKHRLFVVAALAAMSFTLSSSALAARLRNQEPAGARARAALDDEDANDGGVKNLPAGTRIERDVAYGADPKQRFDVYMPAQAKNAPVIFMVHGGGWRRGDKASSRVVENKAKHWLPQGYVFISVNNRLLPTSVAEQAQDVAHALAYAQAHASKWGADATRFVLMGHSAGSHLIGLVSSSPTLAAQAGVKPWLGSVLLDSAAFDVAAIMRGPHLSLYDDAFGKDTSTWRALSPLSVLTASTPPVLAVCSSRRVLSCGQARAYAEKAKGFGTRASVLPEDLSHGEINATLGEASAYTDAVDAFVRSLGVAAAVAK